MVRVDKESDPASVPECFLLKENACALVIEADTITLPLFALDQASLP